MPGNASYTSPLIQNQLLKLSADCVLDEIRKQIASSPYCAVIADETKDVSKTEQLSICLRYLYGGCVVDRFVGFTAAEAVDAASLSTLIISVLHSLGVEKNQLLAQCYDGAAVMKGHRSGVQCRLREAFPLAAYVHCANHSLQLALVQASSVVPEANSFFSLLNGIYDFVTNSSPRFQRFLALQDSEESGLAGESGTCRLVKPSDTRWSCYYRSITAVRRLFAVLLRLLTELSTGIDDDAVKAAGYLAKLKEWNFVTCLVMLERLFGIVRVLSDQLQAEKMDVPNTIIVVSTSCN